MSLQRGCLGENAAHMTSDMTCRHALVVYPTEDASRVGRQCIITRFASSPSLLLTPALQEMECCVTGLYQSFFMDSFLISQKFYFMLTWKLDEDN